MSVTIVNQTDTLARINSAQSVASEVKENNFFDVFGTTGCLLNCADGATLEQIFPDNRTNKGASSRTERKRRRAARREHLDQFHKSHQHIEWFTAGQITASATQGCESCRVLSEILQKTFEGNQKGLSDQHEYSREIDFTLRRRSRAQKDGIESIQLFQPRGL